MALLIDEYEEASPNNELPDDEEIVEEDDEMYDEESYIEEEVLDESVVEEFEAEESGGEVDEGEEVEEIEEEEEVEYEEEIVSEEDEEEEDGEDEEGGMSDGSSAYDDNSSAAALSLSNQFGRESQLQMQMAAESEGARKAREEELAREKARIEAEMRAQQESSGEPIELSAEYLEEERRRQREALQRQREQDEAARLKLANEIRRVDMALAKKRESVSQTKVHVAEVEKKKKKALAELRRQAAREELARNNDVLKARRGGASVASAHDYRTGSLHSSLERDRIAARYFASTHIRGNPEPLAPLGSSIVKNRKFATTPENVEELSTQVSEKPTMVTRQRSAPLTAFANGIMEGNDDDKSKSKSKSSHDNWGTVNEGNDKLTPLRSKASEDETGDGADGEDSKDSDKRVNEDEPTETSKVESSAGLDTNKKDDSDQNDVQDHVEKNSKSQDIPSSSETAEVESKNCSEVSKVESKVDTDRRDATQSTKESGEKVSSSSVGTSKRDRIVDEKKTMESKNEIEEKGMPPPTVTDYSDESDVKKADESKTNGKGQIHGKYSTSSVEPKQTAQYRLKPVASKAEDNSIKAANKDDSPPSETLNAESNGEVKKKTDVFPKRTPITQRYLPSASGQSESTAKSTPPVFARNRQGLVKSNVGKTNSDKAQKMTSVPATSEKPEIKTASPSSNLKPQTKAPPRTNIGTSQTKAKKPAQTKSNPVVKVYSIDALRQRGLPGVDYAHREQYLSAEEFKLHFKMSKEEFGKLPKWKRDKAKRSLGLF